MELTDTELVMLISFIQTLGDQNPRNLNNDTRTLLKKLQDELNSRPLIKAEASPASEPPTWATWNPAPAIKPDDGREYVGNLVGRTCGHMEECYVLPADSDDPATKREQYERIGQELIAATKLPCTACAAAGQPEKHIPRDYLGYQFHGHHVPAVGSLAEAHADRERMKAFTQDLHARAREPEGEG